MQGDSSMNARLMILLHYLNAIRTIVPLNVPFMPYMEETSIRDWIAHCPVIFK